MNSHTVILLLMALVSLASGCASLGPSRVGLSRNELGSLHRRAVAPADLDVSVASSATGGLLFRGTYGMDNKADVAIPLIRHLKSGSRNPVVSVVINGQQLTASIDTGASFSIVTLEAALRAGVTPLGPDLIELTTVTFGGTQRPVLGISEHIELGPLSIAKIPFGILRRIPGMSRNLEDSLSDVDMILGQDLLRQFKIVVFEAGSQELRLIGRTSAATLDRERVIEEVSISQSRSRIPAFQATISGRGPIPVVFDSGGGFGLWIPEHVAQELGLADADSALESALDRAFKTTSSHPARPSSLRVGGFLADGLPTRIGIIRGGEQSPDFALLGNHILKTTSVAIDYRSKTVLFLRK